MKRRKFIKRATAVAATTFTAPYILPSGRLFARTGTAMANHVVVVLFAGGVRQQETMLQRYLAESQGLNIEGNILYNILEGQAPEVKIVYGTVTPDGQPGGLPIDPILNNPLEKQGTLFPEVRYSGGSTGHFTGLSTAMSGYYGVTQGLRQHPLRPTIFEYLRRYAGAKATDVWFVGNGIGNSTPLLNHSVHPDFGAKYGANFFAPNITFGQQGMDYFEGAKVYHPDEELVPMQEMRAFLNQSFLQNQGGIPNLNNTEAEKEDIKAFMKHVFEQVENDQIAFPPVTDSGDLSTIGYTTEVLKWFKPKLTIINMSAPDSCHESYTNYLQAVHRADHGIGFLWNYIQQNIPEMANDTALLVMPEHGRNYEPNAILDVNDWLSFDHDSDENSRRIFSLMVGPMIDADLKVGGVGNPVGNAADLVPTIAEILGVKNEVMNAGLLDPSAMSLFDRI